jgi:transposase
MWTEERRRIYRREGDGYSSHLRDAEWVRLYPLVPKASPGGRPGKTDMRVAMNAIPYLLRTGCPWRYLPRDSFPPRSTVNNIFCKFRRGGVSVAIWAEPHMAFARANGPGGQFLGGGSRRAIGQIGGKTGGKDNQAGYAAGKEVKGRKIHALVDSEGLPIRGRRRFRRHPGPRRGRAHPRQATRRFRWLGLTWTGGGCNAWQGESLAVAKVPAPRMEFVVLPRRWVVERTFCGFGRNRRLAKGFENLAQTPATLVYPRLHPACPRAACQGVTSTNPGFCYARCEGRQIGW